MKPTILALISGFLISFTSTITFLAIFLVRSSSNLILFSPVLPKTNDAFAVYTTTIISSLVADIKISPKGIPVNSLFTKSLTVISKPNWLVYAFLSAYQEDFHDFI
jgi:hypothetical protein